jgi:hypothetical protein
MWREESAKAVFELACFTQLSDTWRPCRGAAARSWGLVATAVGRFPKATPMGGGLASRRDRDIAAGQVLGLSSGYAAARNFSGSSARHISNGLPLARQLAETH